MFVPVSSMFVWKCVFYSLNSKTKRNLWWSDMLIRWYNSSPPSSNIVYFGFCILCKKQLIISLMWSPGWVKFWKELLVTVTDVSKAWTVVIFRVKVILCRQWMVFMSLVIDLIGQLNYHVIGCKTRKRWLVRFDPSIVLVSLLLVKSSVHSVVCPFWSCQWVGFTAQVAVIRWIWWKGALLNPLPIPYYSKMKFCVES